MTPAQLYAHYERHLWLARDAGRDEEPILAEMDKAWRGMSAEECREAEARAARYARNTGRTA